MRRYLVMLVGIILVVGGVLFEEKHRAETFKNHIAPPELEYARLLRQPAETKTNFADYASLWGSPWTQNPDPDLAYSSLTFQKDLVPAGSEKILVRPGVKTEPVLTVQDREATYAIFSGGGFKLTVNLKPAYATPDSLLPNHLDPSIGGSFSF